MYIILKVWSISCEGLLGYFLYVVGLYLVIVCLMGYYFCFGVFKFKGLFSVYFICGVGNEIY